MRRKMKNCVALAMSAALVLASLTGCSVKSTKTDEPANGTSSIAAGEGTETENTNTDGGVVKATEGSITVYTAFEDDQIDKYLASFKELYPNINVEVIRESTGTLVAKVIAEKDNPVADVIWGTSASVMLQLEPYGIIKGYRPEGTELLDPKFYDSKNEEPLWTGCDVYETAFLVNTQVCEEAGVPIPQSFEDLLDPCYEGMIVMPDPTSSGTGMLTVNGILQIMISKASVSRLLNKLQGIGYLSLVSFTGRHGSVIYLCNYLSTMFAVSDVMIDKEEVSMTFKVPIHLPDDNSILDNTSIRDEQIVIDTSVNSISGEVSSVSESHIRAVIKKVAGILATQGLSCCECPNTVYKLYSLSDCKGSELNYYLSISCPDGKSHYRFEISLHPMEEPQKHPDATTPEGRPA